MIVNGKFTRLGFDLFVVIVVSVLVLLKGLFTNEPFAFSIDLFLLGFCLRGLVTAK